VTFTNEGLRVLKEDDASRFALIFLGLSLSDMGALKIVAALRAGENNPETPMVLM
jgi:CheY-like chemotaxis protein